MNADGEEQEIHSEAKFYFGIIPNIADDDLGIYEYRLYGHYIRTCGQGGKCFEKTRTTAKILGMGVATVVETRRKLAERTPPYIEIIRRKVGNFERVDVLLCDLWAENMSRFAQPTDRQEKRYRSPGETVPIARRNGTDRQEKPLKKNQYEEEPLKEEEPRSLRSLNGADAPATERTNERTFSLLTDPEIGMSSRAAIEKIMARYPFADVRAFCCKFVAEGHTPSKDAGLIAYWLDTDEVTPTATGAEEFFTRHSTPDEQPKSYSRYLPAEYADLINH